jgi:alanine dehydrogenase
MRVLGSSEVIAALDFSGLIEALRRMLRGRERVNLREQQTAIAVPGAGQGALTIATAWQAGRRIGVELSTDFPGPAASDDSERHGAYLLLDGRRGETLAFLDGPALTARRIAATSALAASYLARGECERLLLIGAGRLAPHLLEAHASARPIRNVLVWDADFDRAAALARRLTRRTLKVAATADLEGAVRGAHIVCCTGDMGGPVLRGEWLPQGAHVDLVLGTAAESAAADDDTLDRCRCYVDRLEATGADTAPVLAGATGNAIVPIAGDLQELAQGRCAGRSFSNQITLFRSTGLTHLDLAAADYALDNVLN